MSALEELAGNNVTISDLNIDVSSVNNTAGNYAAWPDIRLYDVRVCVDHCNQTLTDPRMVTPSFDSDINNVYYNSSTGLWVDISGYKTINVFGIVCVPDPSAVTDIISAELIEDYDTFSEAFDSLSEWINLAWNDVYYTCFPILFILWYVMR